MRDFQEGFYLDNAFQNYYSNELVSALSTRYCGQTFGGNVGIKLCYMKLDCNGGRVCVLRLKLESKARRPI